MYFIVEQIAICPLNHDRAVEFLKELNDQADFIEDVVVAKGSVRGNNDLMNVGHLSFNYNLIPHQVELEVLSYLAGENWMEDRPGPGVSHLGTHCTEQELVHWKKWFKSKRINIAQEVYTESHTSEYLQQKKRKYHYCIFDTFSILGVDLKFIVRREEE